MKIALISPSQQHLQQLGGVLHSCAHQAVLVEGGKSKMREVVECERPDIVVVEGMCCDPTELTQVEYLSTHHPDVAVVLLCASTTPEFLINSMRAGVREVLPCPVNAVALQSALDRIITKMRISQGKTDGRVLAFVGCKGGAGATFLATNLAAELAARRSVMLLDLNLQFGDALSFLHDAEPASTLADVAREIGRLDATFLAASATKINPKLSILAAPEDPAMSMEIKPDHVEAVVSLAASVYDFVLMDVGRTIDGTSVKALDRADKIFVVMQPSVPSVRNAKKLLLAFRALGYGNDRIELIVNRFERSDIGMADIERALGKLAIHTVPNSYRQVSAAINQGDPLARAARGNPVSRNLADFARDLTEEPAEKGAGLLGRLLGRAA
jgi:pilus assembly protein CpaE